MLLHRACLLGLDGLRSVCRGSFLEPDLADSHVSEVSLQCVVTSVMHLYVEQGLIISGASRRRVG